MTSSSAVSQSESEPRASERPRGLDWPDWSGRTAVLIATGPSLTPADVALVHHARAVDRCRVIAINEAGLRQYIPLAAPWADVLYAADRTWWEFYRPEFYGLRVSGESVPTVHTRPLKMLERGEKMPRQPGSVVSAGHSGFQALGLALTLGASRVYLLGYDCGGKKRNCHENRPKQFSKDTAMDQWVQHYNRVPVEWPEVPVINCAADSRITAFEKRPLSEVL